MLNPLRRDPTKTTMIRNSFIADVYRRFNSIKTVIWEFVVTDDAFGLNTAKPIQLQQVPKQAYRFLTDANKVKAYRKWLQQQIDAKILSVDSVTGKPWMAMYVESAYKKGLLHAYTDIHKEALAQTPDFYLGGKAQFLKDAFSSPESLHKIELIYTRAFNDMKGITDVMSQQLSRVLATGVVQGKGAQAIAREMRKTITGITKKRAILVARTETIAAHAEGQLDSFEKLGVEELGIQAEISTAFDACEECIAVADSGPYSIGEARGMIPIHPNCRCSWEAYVE